MTIDDLYKEASIAYENYAQRLGAIYESTRRPEDFLVADVEYRKLLNSGEASTEDFRLYDILHQYMMKECKDKAFPCLIRYWKKIPLRMKKLIPRLWLKNAGRSLPTCNIKHYRNN